MTYPREIHIRPGHPDFLDLPWDIPLSEWQGRCQRLEEVPRGLSRHPVLFVNYEGVLYALKEMPPGVADQEFRLLRQAEEAHLPVVIPVGIVHTQTGQRASSVLVTRYLDSSLPYRILFMSQGLERYRQNLLDAIAGLLVELHLSNFYWGDCSLSNTLFRRDAGALRAYLVDAETAEFHTGFFSPTLRFHDLQRMEENLQGELNELQESGLLPVVEMDVPISDASDYIRWQYQLLWREITREETINPGEHYRIQERIQALNNLGFSVRDVQLTSVENGSKLRLRVLVSDRSFHRDQLYDLTGLDVEEMQARKMMNEIHELRATLSQSNNRPTTLDVAGYYWLENRYYPVINQLKHLIDQDMTAAELYCQILEHKWYLSERAHRDVGHQAATEDYLSRFGVQSRVSGLEKSEY